MLRRFLCLLLAAAFVAAAAQPARAADPITIPLKPLVETIVNLPGLVKKAIDPIRYDEATKCTGHASRGARALENWLTEHRPRGASWGSYRCEMWGKKSASLHAEGRAVDWHLNVHDSRDRREARKLIRAWLAPDADGNQNALARRMGIQEIIWDCQYWGAGMSGLSEYSACYKDNGKPQRGVSDTTAHRDHIHIGITKPAARLKTSFWRHLAAR